MIDEHARVRRGMRELADAVPVPEVGSAALRAAAGPRPRNRWLPVLAAAATAFAVVAVGQVPGLSRGTEAAPATKPDVAVLPEKLLGHSMMTGHVSADPPGPVVALYSSGSEHPPQVVGVDGRSYRDLDAVLDLASGARTAIPGQLGTVDAAFAPDGARLALQRDGELRIVRLDLRGLGFPDGLAIVDLVGGDTVTVDAPAGLRGLLGWRGNGLLVDNWDTIVRVPVAGGPSEVVSSLRIGNDDFVNLQLATALLPSLQVRAMDADRGRWPLSIQLLAVVGALLAGWLGTLLVRGLRR
ncbi:hypothetical protein SAMN05421812_11592 [Asanoa hainanensis]|uniref:Uncharacterized protein n=1 Tax=Asanoa hainanensis TaxID=560556 RepID=A0A239PAG5_9ACTN|nr:hypothetical protein [Asanoa hainanensis]SNT63419.1 hypothetical protein SAMN05421812_11592 [Asanoa hainanensis]